MSYYVLTKSLSHSGIHVSSSVNWKEFIHSFIQLLCAQPYVTFIDTAVKTLCLSSRNLGFGGQDGETR